jgi:Phosphotransferase enzyme family
MEELVHDYPWSKVWRRGDCYRKKCGPSQLHEVPLTLALASRWPDRVAAIVDHGDDWLLMRDAGTPIRALGDALEAWRVALPLYAELQQGEVQHVDRHLAAGVPDQRTATLLERFETFPRLASFAPRFGELLGQLTLPPTVQHDDLHGANVFAKDGVVRILDWGDAVIGHPFSSLMIPMRVHEELAGELRDVYLSAWPRETHAEFSAARTVAAFTRILSWQRIASFSDAPEVQRALRLNFEWFVEHVVDA